MTEPRITPEVSVAPMMDWTDRHYRYLARLLSRRVVLYTEMVHAQAAIHGDRERLLGHDPAESPLVLQLGGADAGDLAEAARIGEAWGYSAINLNVGCPSDRVQSGRFGAALMAEPEHVAELTGAMVEAVDIPVTVKCRIGIDQQDEYADLERFVTTVAASGVETFILHARKAWLQGLSPRENRDVPPLRPERVQRLKAEHPGLAIHINGGIRDWETARAQLHPATGPALDGVMVGRAAYQDPWLLQAVDPTFFGEPAPVATPEEAVAAWLPYAEERHADGAPMTALTRPLLGLFSGRRGARSWRRILSEGAPQAGSGPDLIREALTAVAPAVAEYEGTSAAS
ncbi:MAG: tRNA dihydrouridine(20/20a) synthase DusA [Pseudomonadota bacterium]